MAWGALQLVLLPPHRGGWRTGGGHPQIQAAPRAAPTTIAQSCCGRAKKEELGAKAPLCRVHHCPHPSNPRAICKGSTFLLKDEKSLGELGKVPCEILTELQIGQHT